MDLARLDELVKEVTENMDAYDTVRAGRSIVVYRRPIHVVSTSIT